MKYISSHYSIKRLAKRRSVSSIKMKSGLLILITLLCTAYSLPGEMTGNIRFEHLSLDEGAALNLTYCMMQDHKGFLWFGTMYGLVKYDGRDYKVYKNNPEDPNSISFDDIITLYEDSDNNIWIGTWGGGLNKLEPETGKFTRFLNDDRVKNGISDNIIWSICEDNKGNLWLGTETSGVDKYIPGKHLFVSYTHNPDEPKSFPGDHVRYIYKDQDGTLWFCSRTGLLKYDENSDSFVSIKSPDNISVNTVIEDENGTLWIGTSGGVYVLDKTERKFIKKDYPDLNDKFIYTFCIRENQVWIGTNLGLYKINPETDEITGYRADQGDPGSLSGDNILNLAAGSSGILWINSYGDGMNKLRDTPSRFTSFNNQPGNLKSISSSIVTSFCADEKDFVWVGTRDGLNKFNKQEKTFERFYIEGRSENRITSLLSDGNFIWTGTVKGLKLFDKTTRKFKQPPAEFDANKALNNAYINSIIMVNGRIFIGTSGYGLLIYSPGSGSLDNYGSKQFGSSNNHSDYILSIYKDQLDNNIVWIGTYGGLIQMNCSDNTFRIYTHLLTDKKSLSNDYVFSILRDSYGSLWVGTANGLNKSDSSSQTFEHYFEKDGLPNSVISSIKEDKNGNLWIGTNYGVSQYNISANEFRNYSKEDGLLNNFYFNHSSLADLNGDIYLGGTNGLDIINTSLRTGEKYIPGVYITSFSKTNNNGGLTEISGNKDIKLNYDENFISIRYVSLDYNNPVKNRYKYKLDGLDKDWIDAGNKNIVNYTSLPPGEYTFRVKGSSSSGIFNPNEAVLNFTILPPFWKTSWFNAVLICLLIGSVYLVYRLRVRQKVKHALEIEKIKEMEGEKLRRKTAEDFHDELGHRLTRISLLSEILKRKIGNSPVDIREILDKISLNSSELYEGTKDFIWAIDPRKDSLYELIIRLKDFGDELFQDSDVYFEVSGLDESLKTLNLTTEWKRHLSLIIKEGMNNALKHGMSKKICINSSIKNDELELILTDDGRGFTPELSGKGNGLRNMRQRAEKLSAKIEVESSPGNGTRIFFRGKIPGKQMHYN